MSIETDKYATVFESLPLPAVLVGARGQIERLNQSARTIFGPDPGSFQSDHAGVQGWASWLTGEFLQKLLIGEVEAERELATLSGVRWFRIALNPVHDTDGAVAGTIVLLSDVTDERKARELLNYRGDLARLVSDISTKFVGLTPDQIGAEIESALGSVAEFVGVDAAFGIRFSDTGLQISAAYIWRTGHLNRSQGRFQSIDASAMPWWLGRLRAAETVDVESLDTLPASAAKERRLLRQLGIQALLGIPLSFQGSIVGFVGICSTVRGRHWSEDEEHLLRILGQVFMNALLHQYAEETLTRERNLLRTLINNLPDYIYVKDTASRFILNNAAHLRLLRANRAEDVVGKTDFDIFPKALATRYFADEQAVVHTGRQLVNREEEVLDEHGNKRWVMTTKAPFADAQGNVAGIVGMSRNITERKLMEESLKNHAKLLEQANSDLKSRNQDLDEFTYVASHDLQEPLRKITAFADALKEDLELGDHDAVLKDVEIMSSGAQRMQRLVQDLLTLSRSGRQKMTMAPVALDQCVDSALDALEIRIQERAAVIERVSLPMVSGDALMLTQVFQNLIGNALKFCEGTPHIRLTAEREAGAWVIGVADNGIGIKPAYAKQVFAPFKRLHGRGRYEGTGIGLAICRKIVERHGGTIWVESELGAGAYFKFKLAQ